MYIGLHVKYPLFSPEFNKSRIFTTFSKNTQISNFTKIRPVEAELFHADVQTDTRKLIVAFRNFANAPKKGRLVLRPSVCYLVPPTKHFVETMIFGIGVLYRKLLRMHEIVKKKKSVLWLPYLSFATFLVRFGYNSVQKMSVIISEPSVTIIPDVPPLPTCTTL
jgi:hypothetical protein